MTTVKARLGEEAPGFLDVMDGETQAQRRVEDCAREALGALWVSELEKGLAPRLRPFRFASFETAPAGPTWVKCSWVPWAWQSHHTLGFRRSCGETHSPPRICLVGTIPTPAAPVWKRRWISGGKP
jgi:hypothetical protein